MDKIWKENYYKFLFEDHVEIELRLGKQTSNGFKSDVGEKAFNEIKQNLDKCKWIKVSETVVTDTFYNNNLRKSGELCISKVNTFKSHKKTAKSLDIRLSINIETPVSRVNGNVIAFRKKKRTSYYKDFYRFDLTYIENHDEFEIEMELIDIHYAKKHSYDFIMGNMYRIFNDLISRANF